MAGPITGPGIQSIGAASEHTTFANDIAKATGLDPRVVYAWSQIETGGTPIGHNWLNLRPYPGDPYSGVSSGNFEMFSSVQNAETATIRRINQPFAAALAASKGQPPAAQIAALASTGWDAGHYGGAGGPNLLSVFRSIYPNADTGTAGSGAPVTGGGAQGGKGVVNAVTAPLTSITDAFGFIFSYRFLEILGGGALILVGLYILAQQFKQTALAQAIPLPGPAKEAAASTGLTPEVRERREARTEEVHQVRVKTEQARATELRTRTKHRRLAKAEQAKEVNRAYIRGAAETSPLR